METIEDFDLFEVIAVINEVRKDQYHDSNDEGLISWIAGGTMATLALRNKKRPSRDRLIEIVRYVLMLDLKQ